MIQTATAAKRNAALAEPSGGAAPAEEIADQPERRDHQEGQQHVAGARQRGVRKADIETAKAEAAGDGQRERRQADQRDRRPRAG